MTRTAAVIAEQPYRDEWPRATRPDCLAAHDSARRLAAIFDHSLEFIGLLSPEGTLLEANQTALDFAGATREEVIGRPFWETPWWTRALDPRAGERLREAMAGAARGTGTRLEVDVWRHDGAVVTFDVSITPVRDETGRVIFLIPEGRDITQRKRAEEALRFLAETDVLLASSLDHETTLEHVAERCVPYLADWCAAVGVDGHGVMRRLASAHRDPPASTGAATRVCRYPTSPAVRAGIGRVLRTRQAELVEVAAATDLAALAEDAEHLAQLREMGVVSYMMVPLVSRGEVLGGLSFAMAASGRHYDRSHLAVAQDLAHRTALAVANARLHARVAEITVLHERARFARDLHDGIIQDLYASVLHLEALAEGPGAGPLRQPLQAQRDHLCHVIADVRAYIEELRSPTTEGQAMSAPLVDPVAEESEHSRGAIS